jgi:hypothetical protein
MISPYPKSFWASRASYCLLALAPFGTAALRLPHFNSMNAPCVLPSESVALIEADRVAIEPAPPTRIAAFPGGSVLVANATRCYRSCVVPKRVKKKSPPLRQVNVRVDEALFRSLDAVARHERRSIGQMARRLMEDGLRARVGAGSGEDLTGAEIGGLAREGGAFDWLADEPDLYEPDSGEPI